MRRSMKLGAVAAGLCLCAPAFAEEPEAHFPEVPVAKLTLVDARASRAAAVVEGPDGQAVIVAEGDLVGREKLKVLKIVRGCLSLSADRGAPSLLCVDEAATPRS